MLERLCSAKYSTQKFIIKNVNDNENDKTKKQKQKLSESA